MRYFKNHISRFLVLLIALQILNMSIDAPVMNNADSKITDTFNYIDTYVEYIAEVILKHENAIPESKDRQHKELQMQKQLQLMFHETQPLVCSFVIQKEKKKYLDPSDKYAYQFVKEINPPPPKA